jgi:deazaflavin-dependent oxidoreductase (nitroreductase family)
MPGPRWLARFNLHVTNRLLGPLARRMPGMEVVVQVGRKTHRQYRTPVLVFRRCGRITIAPTYGRESQWVANVLAERGCEFETEGRTLRLSHPHLFHDELRRAMPGFVRFRLRILHVSDFLEFSIAESIASQ